MEAPVKHVPHTFGGHRNIHGTNQRQPAIGRVAECCDFSLGIDVECNHAEDPSGNMHRVGKIIGGAGRIGTGSLPFQGEATLFLQGSFRDLSEVLKVTLAFRP